MPQVAISGLWAGWQFGMMRVVCEMQAPIASHMAKQSHEGERVEMRLDYSRLPDEGWICDGCGYFLDAHEAMFALPYQELELDGMHWAMLDAVPLFVCRPEGIVVEYPRR